MRVKILKEGFRPNEIGYHFTDLYNLVQILNTDVMLSTNSSGEASTKYDTWSITRKKDGMAYRGLKASNHVRITFDIDKLSNNYRIVPFSWSNIKKNNPNFEYEERVEGKPIDSSVKNDYGNAVGVSQIHKYITEVTLHSDFEKLMNNDTNLYKCNKEIVNIVNRITTFENDMSELNLTLQKVQEDWFDVYRMKAEDIGTFLIRKVHTSFEDYDLAVRTAIIQGLIFDNFNKFKEYGKDCQDAYTEYQFKLRKFNQKYSGLINSDYSLEDMFSKMTSADANQLLSTVQELFEDSVGNLKYKGERVTSMSMFKDYLESKGIALTFSGKDNGGFNDSVSEKNLVKMYKKFKNKVKLFKNKMEVYSRQATNWIQESDWILMHTFEITENINKGIQIMKESVYSELFNQLQKYKLTERTKLYLSKTQDTYIPYIFGLTQTIEDPALEVKKLQKGNLKKVLTKCKFTKRKPYITLFELKDIILEFMNTASTRHFVDFGIFIQLSNNKYIRFKIEKRQQVIGFDDVLNVLVCIIRDVQTLR